MCQHSTAFRLEASDLTMSRWPPPHWLGAHPQVVDWVVVLACVAIQVAATSIAGRPADWTAYITVLLTAIVLLWRRRYPLIVLTVAVTISSIGSLLHPDLAYQNTPFVFAVYTVASTQRFRRAIAGYAIGIAIPILAALLHGAATRTAFSPTVLDPIALVALAIGVAVRSQHERRQAVAELINQRLEYAKITERARISAEMHDVVAHSLSVMIALANGAATAWQKHPERAIEALHDLSDVGRTAQGDLRRILLVLRDNDDADAAEPLLQSGHNLPALDELIETFRTTGLPVTLTRKSTPLPDDAALTTTVYRIVQESLTNALRYATGATRVDVLIDNHGDSVEITVTDNGTGKPVPSPGTGSGLLGIAARAETYNGSSHAGPVPGGGWRTATTLRLPRRATSGLQ